MIKYVLLNDKCLFLKMLFFITAFNLKSMQTKEASTITYYENEAAIFKAVKNNDIELVKRQIENDFKVNCVDLTGLTPLHAAAFYGYNEIINILIGAGSLINKQAFRQCNYTPLTFAVQNGHWKTVKLLISNGADVNLKIIRDHSQFHLLFISWSNKVPSDLNESYVKIIKTFLKNNANVYSKNIDGEIPLHFILTTESAECSKKKYELMLQELLGASLLFQSKFKNVDVSSQQKEVKNAIEKTEKCKANYASALLNYFVEKDVPALCIQMITDELFKTNSDVKLGVRNLLYREAFFQECYKSISTYEKFESNLVKKKREKACCFVESLYENHLKRVQSLVCIQDNEGKTIIDRAHEKDISLPYVENIMEIQSFNSLDENLKSKIEKSYSKRFALIL